jgi:hypothetical protein
MKEAMKLALEAVEELHRTGDTQVFDMCYAQPVIKALEEALAKQEQGEQDTLAYREAASLAQWLFNKHFAHEEHYASGRVVWELCDTTAAVISQIDNMVCKLVREQEQGEPSCCNGNCPNTKDCEQAMQCLYTTPQQRKPLTDEHIFAIGKELGLKCRLGGNTNIDIDYARAIEAAHGIKESE